MKSKNEPCNATRPEVPVWEELYGPAYKTVKTLLLSGVITLEQMNLTAGGGYFQDRFGKVLHGFLHAECDVKLATYDSPYSGRLDRCTEIYTLDPVSRQAALQYVSAYETAARRIADMKGWSYDPA